MRRPAGMDPASKGYQRLARRIASTGLREALRVLRRFGTVEDIREATGSVCEIIARRRAAAKEGE